MDYFFPLWILAIKSYSFFRAPGQTIQGRITTGNCGIWWEVLYSINTFITETLLNVGTSSGSLLELHAAVTFISISGRFVCPTKLWDSWETQDCDCLAFYHSPSFKERTLQRVSIPQTLIHCWIFWRDSGSRGAEWTQVENRGTLVPLDLFRNPCGSDEDLAIPREGLGA